jgi:uncharacterized protein (DUF1778 family)
MTATRTTSSASARLDLRLDPEHKALIERAAEYEGQTVTGFVIATLVREARRIVDAREITRLSDVDRDRFLDLLANPPGPTPALERAARRHRELISRSE